MQAGASVSRNTGLCAKDFLFLLTSAFMNPGNVKNINEVEKYDEIWKTREGK